MDRRCQVLSADGHLQDVIEIGVLHQLLTGRAGRIRSTRSSAPADIQVRSLK
ncbi:TPA: hypothetical protein L5621_006279 [Pseudomonas aeruginosa]|nr:hypothetical protein [Pseudomonas aeruginosa]